MKSLLPVLLLMFLFVSQSFGQVGIGTETPHPSAALEISSSSKGLLISRMSFNQRNAIEAPATGLLIYQTDGLKGFYYFDGQSWILLNPIQQIPQNINAEDPLTELVLSKVATSGDFSDLLNIPDFVYAADTTQMLMPYLTMSKLFPTLNLKADLVALQAESERAKTTESTLAVAIDSKEDAANKSTDGTFADNSDEKFPTQKAVKTYVDGKQIDLTSKVTGILPISNGGTGSSTQNFVDLTTNQTISGVKSFSKDLIVSGITVGAGSGDSETVLYNAALGLDALKNNTGWGNVGIGRETLTVNENSNNTAVGYTALKFSTYGNSNTGLGSRALDSNTEGNMNTAIGANTLRTNILGSQNTAVGNNADVTEDGLINATAIGNGARVSSSNTIQLGNTDVISVKTSGKLTTGTITLPNTDGTNGQVLSTNGNGIVSWVTPSTASSSTFVDLSTNQSISGNKTFNNTISLRSGDSQNATLGTRGFVDNLFFGQANFVYAPSIGRNNTVMGTFAFTSSSGSNNTVMGKDAMRQGINSSGNDNTALGFRALTNAQDGSFNTAVGVSTMESGVGSYNTALGNRAGASVSTGTKNTLLGSNSNVSVGTLNNATAIGYGAVVSSSNTIQLGNTDVTSVKTSGKLTTGAITLPNEDGTNGQVLSTNGSGLVSWVTPSTASSSTFVDLTSTQEIAGAKTFSSDIVINELNIGKGGGNIVSNSVFGKYSLIQNTTGDINTAVGMSSLGSNTTGRGNSGFGYLSLYNNTTGSQNTGIGVAALEKNTTGFSNLGLGFRALGENINGSENISIGHNSGINNVSGSNNIFIGSGANASGNFNNSIAIGTNALTTESNSIQLGNSSITTVKTSGQLTTGEITYPRVKGSEGQLLMTDGAGSASWTSTLSNGTTATTQAANDNSTKVATTAYVDRQVISGGAIDLPITELDGTSVVGIKTIFLTGQDGNYVDLRTLKDGVKGQVINLVFAPQNFNHKLEVIVNPTGNMAVPSGIIFDTNNTGGIVLIFDGVYWRVMNRPGSIN